MRWRAQRCGPMAEADEYVSLRPNAWRVSAAAKLLRI
jgi:hypothetical protein